MTLPECTIHQTMKSKKEEGMLKKVSNKILRKCTTINTTIKTNKLSIMKT